MSSLTIFLFDDLFLYLKEKEFQKFYTHFNFKIYEDFEMCNAHSFWICFNNNLKNICSKRVNKDAKNKIINTIVQIEIK